MAFLSLEGLMQELSPTFLLGYLKWLQVTRSKEGVFYGFVSGSFIASYKGLAIILKLGIHIFQNIAISKKILNCFFVWGDFIANIASFHLGAKAQAPGVKTYSRYLIFWRDICVFCGDTQYLFS